MIKGEVNDDKGEPIKDASVEISYKKSGESIKVKINGNDGKFAAIIKIEEESKKQANQATVAGQGGAPLRPAEASRPLGGKGPGQVTKKKIGQSTGWGDLPPKEREQAMQEISREFPAHYREVIEAYFRELARQQK